MEIIYHKLYKIDIETQDASIQEFDQNDNVEQYIYDLLSGVSESEGDREYLFEEGSITMKTYLTNIVQNQDRDSTCQDIATRLLKVETKAQEGIERLNKKIQRGMLIISFVKINHTDFKIILSKADYNEFIEEITGKKRSGLPLEKKIFKSFVGNISIDDDDDENEFNKLVTYDSNTKKTVYWTNSFLELVEIRDDEKNTLTAFNAIKRKILNPLRKKHKADYLLLWNATIAYFRREGDFDIDYYKDEIIGNHQPIDENLKMNPLKNKIDKLPSDCNFDKKFSKAPKAVKAKFKNTIKLSDEIDLILKHDVPNPQRTFVPFENDQGEKYIAIKSEEGFEYARRQQN